MATGKIDNFLGRLGDAASDLPEEYIESAVLALFDTGEKLETRLLSDNQLLRVASVVHKLLTRVTEPARLSFLLTAAARGVSLGAVVYFTRLYSEHSQMEKALLDEAGWNEVRNKLVIRISTAAEEMSLAQSPHLGILLYRWKEWAPIEDSQRFVRRLIESDDGVLAFLQGMIAQKSSSVGKYASRMGWYLPIDSVLILTPGIPFTSSVSARNSDKNLWSQSVMLAPGPCSIVHRSDGPESIIRATVAIILLRRALVTVCARIP